MATQSGESAEAEHVIARIRPRGRHLIWPALVLVGLAGASGYFLGNLAEEWETITVLILIGASFLVLVVLPFFSWLARRYVITTRRLIVRRGLFVRVRQELLHSRGYDVTVRQTAFQRMANCGDIRVNSGLENPMVLKDVPGATLVQRVLQDLMEASMNPISAGRQQVEAVAGDETTYLGTR